MKAKGYIFSRPFMGERVPQSVQNLVLRNYCSNNKIIFELSSTEYAMEESYYVLNKLINDEKYKSIIFYSLFQLPENDKKRISIIKKIISKKKVAIFALEGISLKNKKEIEDIENIWLIKKALKKSLSIKEAINSCRK
ncbi:hypothetical protein N9S55_01570 [Candidatus Pelagibacter bacterium]|nr:LIC12192 family sporadic carbohydrate cluster protein [Candidatus Pelagibacter bacterium]MDA9625052.1 hypothetical protein [Candidatus Pelagibacter bacterium]